MRGTVAVPFPLPTSPSEGPRQPDWMGSGEKGRGPPDMPAVGVSPLCAEEPRYYPVRGFPLRDSLGGLVPGKG